MPSDGPPAGAAAGWRERWWFPLLTGSVLVIAIGLVVARYAHGDAVSAWKVLAWCRFDGDTAGLVRVAAAPDVRPCRSDPRYTSLSRGWPVVAFVVPADSDGYATVTGIRSDREQRTIAVEYRTSSGPAADHLLVFVEVPPNIVPDAPFTVLDAAGSSQVPVGADQ